METAHRLLEGIGGDEEAVKDHLAALTYEEVEEIVKSLPLYQDHENAIDLIQCILHLPVRRKCIPIIIQLILGNKVRNRWAVEFSMGYMAFTDTLLTKPNELAAEINDTIQSVLELLEYALTSPSFDATCFQAVLDSIPTLVSFAPSSTMHMQTALQSILSLPWSIQSLASLLVFCNSSSFDLSTKQHLKLQTLYKSIMTDFSSQTSYPFWHDCLTACFGLSEDLMWIQLVRKSFDLIPHSLHREMDFFIQTVFQNNPIYVDRWYQSVQEHPNISKWDLQVYLHALHASQPLFKLVAVRDTLHHKLTQSFLVALNACESIEETTLHLLMHSNHWKGRVLLEVAHTWLDAAPFLPSLLLTLFIEVVELRQDIISFVLSGVEAQEKRKVLISTLKILVDDHPGLLQLHGQEIQERISQLFQADPLQGSQLVEIFTSLVYSTPSYYHFLMVFLRKRLVSPSPEFSIHHWCMLLRSKQCSSAQIEDIASCLNDAIYLTSCRHIVLEELNSIDDCSYFEAAIIECLRSLVHIDEVHVIFNTEELTPHSGAIFRNCISLLENLSPSSVSLVKELQNAISPILSHQHCHSFISSAHEPSLAMAFYSSLALLNPTEKQLRCTLLTSLPDPLAHASMSPNDIALELGTCCIHWDAWCITQLERLGMKNIDDKSHVASWMVQTYLEVQSKPSVIFQDDHPMNELNITRKSVKRHDLLIQLIRIFIQLHKEGVMAPTIWHVTSWKPVRKGLIQQLEPYLESQSQVGYSVAILEYLYVLFTDVDPSLQSRGAGMIYSLLCSHVVTSPRIVLLMLQIAWLESNPDIKWMCLYSVLAESQQFQPQETDNDEERIILSPMLTTGSTRKVAYTSGLRQLEAILVDIDCIKVSALAKLLHVAWIDSSVSYIQAAHTMDILLRAGKSTLSLVSRDPVDMVTIQMIVEVCMKVGASWKSEPSVADVHARMLRFLLDVSSAVTTNKTLRAANQLIVKQMSRDITKHVVSMTQTPQQKRQPWIDFGKKKRVKLRSRHAYIDDCLQEEGGDDAYADLEDFIV